MLERMQGHTRHSRLTMPKPNKKKAIVMVDTSKLEELDMDDVFAVETDINKLRGCAMCSALSNRGYFLKQNQEKKYHYEIRALPGHLEERKKVEKVAKKESVRQRRNRKRMIVEKSDDVEKKETLNVSEEVIRVSPKLDVNDSVDSKKIKTFENESSKRKVQKKSKISEVQEDKKEKKVKKRKGLGNEEMTVTLNLDKALLGIDEQLTNFENLQDIKGIRKRGRKPKIQPITILQNTSQSTLLTTPTPLNAQGIPVYKPERLPNIKKPISQEVLPCRQILNHLKLLPEASPFLTPVDPIAQNLPDYYVVITHPMDLNTITKKFRYGIYEHIDDFANDVRLVFKNAMKYNPPRNTIHIFASTLLRYFDDQIKEIYDCRRSIKVIFNQDEHNYWNDQREWMDFKQSIEELKEEQGILPLKMEEERVIPLSFEEKIELSKRLEEVEGAKQEEVLKYLKIDKDEGEIEIKFETLNEQDLIMLNKIVSPCN
ncbi:hypothetical protein ENUP19_0296G0032 [Entamoeba nuttalli]|uniref:Bromodomain containing protein n=2 Tax=Entamoeba nuttalli TaxID=412467 RepID=K2HHB9_ENTNP|nr:bromodomain containing protein [Entamoeba nuttalli P19]EKE42339.1 bromodomain containing protein [Entamoeba nuttalli P19]|eukprot:XP_008855326.1 bromodomain containing protein [Entamoeba nuttalli P19]